MQAIIHEAGTAGDGQVPVFTVHALGNTGGNTGFQTFEFTVQYKVDHTRKGISTVGSRRTAGDYVHALHQCRGEVVDVGSAAGVSRDYPRAVEQYQRTLGTHATQVQEAAAGSGKGGATALGSAGIEELWQLVELLCHGGGRVKALEFGLGDGGDRSRCGHAGGGTDTGTRYLDFFEFFFDLRGHGAWCCNPCDQQ